ncbi:hypothetical protein ACFSSA_12025 [Luteolibacter algae]|uniref:Uncharacterized protein n=1 Tax=Luteolibacter algae TaxID=454151 RepID=A0ABW5D8Y1_9BACT
MIKLEQWFDSLETGKPFDTCRICVQSLRETADSWIVNKHYHREECILEYAICEGCRKDFSGRFSEASKAEIRSFLESEIDWEARLLEWMALDQPAEKLDHCVACRTSRTGIDGFTLSAQFNGDGTLINGALPLLLCSGCVGNITSRLSDESQKVWQDFISDYFEGL